MTDKIDVTQADRLLVADMLDEVSNLLDHNGIGQVADLIRDGEYDEHDCVKIAANHRLATRTDATPVAWMYEKNGGRVLHFTRTPEFVTKMGHTETPLFSHPPATDVAALVEAAKKAEIILSGAPAIAQYRQSTLTELRQALAPFTKGQP